MKPGFHVWHDSAYWVPILLAYTGARREEVAKAIVDDITMIDDVWVLRIRETETGRVKTASSVRDVPLAEEVLRLGFLDFVEQRRQTGVAALFPELASGGSNYGDAFYKKWWRAFMRAGLVRRVRICIRCGTMSRRCSPSMMFPKNAVQICLAIPF